MDLHHNIAATIFNIPKNGSRDMRPWLRAIQDLCRIYGVFEAKAVDAAVWSWASLRQCVVKIENIMRGALQGVRNFRAQHPYASFVIAVILVGVGVGLVLPAAAIGILNAIGFGAGGVAAGSVAAAAQSAIYGGATGGLFSILQSIGATAVAPSLLTVLAGSGAGVAGIWFGS